MLRESFHSLDEAYGDCEHVQLVWFHTVCRVTAEAFILHVGISWIDGDDGWAFFRGKAVETRFFLTKKFSPFWIEC
jgi:hypothetical protein